MKTLNKFLFSLIIFSLFQSCENVLAQESLINPTSVSLVLPVASFEDAVLQYLSDPNNRNEQAPTFKGVYDVVLKLDFWADYLSKTSLESIAKDLEKKYLEEGQSRYEKDVDSFLKEIATPLSSLAGEKIILKGVGPVTLGGIDESFPKSFQEISSYKASIAWRFGGKNHFDFILRAVQKLTQKRLLSSSDSEPEKLSLGLDVHRGSLCSKCGNFKDFLSIVWTQLWSDSTPRNDDLIDELKNSVLSIESKFGPQWTVFNPIVPGRIRPGATPGNLVIKCGSVEVKEDPCCLLCLLEQVASGKTSYQDQVGTLILHEKEGSETDNWVYENKKVEDIISPLQKGFNLNQLLKGSIGLEKISPFIYARLVLAPKINYQSCEKHMSFAYQLKAQCLAKRYCNWPIELKPVAPFSGTFDQLIEFLRKRNITNGKLRNFLEDLLKEKDAHYRSSWVAARKIEPSSRSNMSLEELAWEIPGGELTIQQESSGNFSAVKRKEHKKIILKPIANRYPRNKQEDYLVKPVLEDQEDGEYFEFDLQDATPEHRLRIALNLVTFQEGQNPYRSLQDNDEDYKIDEEKFLNFLEKIRKCFVGSPLEMFVAHREYWELKKDSRFVQFFGQALEVFTKDLNKTNIDDEELGFLKTSGFRYFLLSQATRAKANAAKLIESAQAVVVWEDFVPVAKFKDAIEQKMKETTAGIDLPVLFGANWSGHDFFEEADLKKDIETVDNLSKLVEIPKALDIESSNWPEVIANSRSIAQAFFIKEQLFILKESLSRSYNPFVVQRSKIAASLARDALKHLFQTQVVNLEQEQINKRVQDMNIWVEFLGRSQLTQEVNKKDGDVKGLDPSLQAWNEYFEIALVNWKKRELQRAFEVFLKTFVDFVHQDIKKKLPDIQEFLLSYLEEGTPVLRAMVEAIKKAGGDPVSAIVKACELEREYFDTLDLLKEGRDQLPTIDKLLVQAEVFWSRAERLFELHKIFEIVADKSKFPDLDLVSDEEKIKEIHSFAGIVGDQKKTKIQEKARDALYKLFKLPSKSATLLEIAAKLFSGEPKKEFTTALFGLLDLFDKERIEFYEKRKKYLETQAQIKERTAEQEAKKRAFEGSEGLARQALEQEEKNMRENLIAMRDGGPVRQLTLGNIYKDLLALRFGEFSAPILSKLKKPLYEEITQINKALSEKNTEVIRARGEVVSLVAKLEHEKKIDSLVGEKLLLEDKIKALEKAIAGIDDHFKEILKVLFYGSEKEKSKVGQVLIQAWGDDFFLNTELTRLSSLDAKKKAVEQVAISTQEVKNITVLLVRGLLVLEGTLTGIAQINFDPAPDYETREKKLVLALGLKQPKDKSMPKETLPDPVLTIDKLYDLFSSEVQLFAQLKRPLSQKNLEIAQRRFGKLNTTPEQVEKSLSLMLEDSTYISTIFSMLDFIKNVFNKSVEPISAPQVLEEAYPDPIDAKPLQDQSWIEQRAREIKSLYESSQAVLKTKEAKDELNIEDYLELWDLYKKIDIACDGVKNSASLASKVFGVRFDGLDQLKSRLFNAASDVKAKILSKVSHEQFLNKDLEIKLSRIKFDLDSQLEPLFNSFKNTDQEQKNLSIEKIVMLMPIFAGLIVEFQKLPKLIEPQSIEDKELKALEEEFVKKQADLDNTRMALEKAKLSIADKFSLFQKELSDEQSKIELAKAAQETIVANVPKLTFDKEDSRAIAKAKNSQQYKEAQADIDKATKKIAKLNSSIERLKSGTGITTLEADLKKLEVEVAQASEKLNQAKSSYANYQLYLKASKLELVLQKQFEQLNEIISANYELKKAFRKAFDRFSSKLEVAKERDKVDFVPPMKSPRSPRPRTSASAIRTSSIETSKDRPGSSMRPREKAGRPSSRRARPHSGVRGRGAGGSTTGKYVPGMLVSDFDKALAKALDEIALGEKPQAAY